MKKIKRETSKDKERVVGPTQSNIAHKKILSLLERTY